MPTRPSRPGRRRGRRMISHRFARCSRRRWTCTRRYAGYFAPYDHIMDPLIDETDYGMNVRTIRPLFEQLRGQLVPLVEAVTAASPVDDSCLKQTFPDAAQWEFGLKVARGIGYDFERGRLDRAAHPFTTNFSQGDVRITTRVKEHDLGRRARSARSTSAATRCTNRASIRRTRRRRSAAARRRASTRASRGCGRTWSAAAWTSGTSTTPGSSRYSRSSWARSRSKPSTARSTRSSAR